MLRVVKHRSRLLRGGRCPAPGNVEGKVGCNSEQHDLVQDVAGQLKEFGLDDL